MSDKNIINDLYKTTPSGRNCESGVLDSKTLNECENKCSIPMGRTGPLVAKIPVVLSDLEIQIDLEAKIKLEEPALDVKTIDKHIYLTQCNLIPHTEKLFISGYVQKNIQFSSIACANNTSVSGHIYHTTVKVPFKCVTKIQFSKCPLYGKEYKTKSNILNEKMMGKDTKEDSWIHYSKLHEPVYCELEYAKILETDTLNREFTIQDTSLDENPFQELTEKMVIFIRLKLLQNQQVCIPEPQGDVTVIEPPPSSLKDHESKKNIHIEVGYDPEKGMIGKEVPSNDFYED